MGIFSKIKRHEGKVGGGFYFVSVLCLSLLAFLTSAFLFVLFPNPSVPVLSSGLAHLGFVAVGALVGLVIRGRLSVFIHELKHSIVSSLAGNSAKGMKIDEDTGHFEYTFTKQTAHLNGFISLAPYTFPFFTLVSLVGFALLYSREPMVARALVSAALGLDLVQNFKHVGSYQTDFSEVRGGFPIGVLYVLSFNIVLICLVTLAVVFGLAGFLEFAAWMLGLVLEKLVDLNSFSPGNHNL